MEAPRSDVAVVKPAARLRGVLGLPGDKSISHRALLLAALAGGNARIHGAGDGEDVRTTARLVEALGVTLDREPTGDGRTIDYAVRSPGAAGLREPDDVLDCGNSGTSLRLLAGVLAGRPWTTVLTGDSSLRRRPIARIVKPLRAMGADVHGRRSDTLPPIAITGTSPLRAIDWTTEVPSAQVKSSILLAGLAAEGRTTVAEIVATRDHTERMLRARGVRVESVDAGPDGGARVTIEGGQAVAAVDETVPGDVSAAAFWLVAAAIHPDAELRLDGVGLNPTRTEILDLLERMGADVRIAADRGPDTATNATGEPRGSVVARSSDLRPIDVEPHEVAAAIDEIPVLCLAATQAAGTSTIRGVGELRVKESDRVAGIAAGLIALGARVDVEGDVLRVHGPTPLRGAAVDALGDHRLAMTFAVAALVAGSETAIAGSSSASISYPGFFDDLERIVS
ncbi:MAG TPA: 3-phosphoshikimate 1-carboxyvinyltransferase [Candidatus Limnocylindrales bacterium]